MKYLGGLSRAKSVHEGLIVHMLSSSVPVGRSDRSVPQLLARCALLCCRFPSGPRQTERICVLPLVQSYKMPEAVEVAHQQGAERRYEAAEARKRCCRCRSDARVRLEVRYRNSHAMIV